MTTKRVRDFLDKELFVNRDIVTFRSLSRELGIHVNDAKNELQCYYDAVRSTNTPAVPTYLVSGEVPALMVPTHPPASTQQSESAMDVDPEFDEDINMEQLPADVVYQSKVLLVDARMLDEAKAQFSCLHSVHIYSLSPSRLVDAGLVCMPTSKVHKADVNGSPGFFSVVGKITGSHVKRRTGAVIPPAASSSKTTLDLPPRVTPRPVVPARAEQQTTKSKAPSNTKEHAPPTILLTTIESRDKPRPSGKLDWSKAKTKEKLQITDVKKEEKKPKIEPDSPPVVADSLTNKKTGLEAKKQTVIKSEIGSIASGDVQRRGMKRRPITDTDLESESASSSAETKPSMVAGPSVKKGSVYSDEDDDGEVRMLGQRRPKRSAMTSDSEMSLRAMMDIDDEQVNRVPRVGKVIPQREEVGESEEEERNEPDKEATAPVTTEDEESDHVPVVMKRRKPRKVVPVGRNGLKKRRVIKSRMTTDAKGYMQTEDYSSYESVEEEEEGKTKPRGKGKGKETKKASEPIDKAEVKPKVVTKEEIAGKLKAKPLAKPRGGASKRGGLLNFFGPEREKR